MFFFFNEFVSFTASTQCSRFTILFLKSFKFLIGAILVIIFLVNVKVGYKRLNDGEMTFSTSSNVEDVFTYPAITVCVTMDVNFTNGFDNVEWLEPEKYDFTFPYLDLGIIKDGKFRQIVFQFDL